MIGIMLFLLPFIRTQRYVTVYEYLERRFGPGSRTLLSLLFPFLRAFATGVTVYGISLVIQTLAGIPFWVAVLLRGGLFLYVSYYGCDQTQVQRMLSTRNVDDGNMALFINGPILEAFLLATCARRAHDVGAVAGILAGFAANLIAWRLPPGVSWLWWNVSGCLITLALQRLWGH